MSIHIMSAVFESTCLRPTERLIMLSLADHADDSGRCYPSISRLCARTGLSERAVRTNIRKLEEAKYLRIEVGKGRRGANLYIVSATPAGNAPRKEMPPGRRNRKGGQEVPEHGAGGAPEPSMNRYEYFAGAPARAETKLELFARKIREGAYVPSTALKPEEGREMVRQGLVTVDQLLRVGVYV